MSLVQTLGLGLVKLAEFFVPAVSAVVDFAAVIGWLFLLMIGLLVLRCVVGLARR